MTIFEESKNYNFDEVKKYILDGGDINVCNEEGHSILTCFINGYYRFGEFLTPEEERLLKEHEDDDEYTSAFLPAVLKTPLNERKNDIFNQIEYLFNHRADPNLCIMVDGWTETALMNAVSHLDFYLVKYLLEHGADPGVWLFDDHKFIDKEDKEYWLIEEMDYAIFSGDARGECEKLVRDIAGLLKEYGLQNWSGFAID